MMTRYTLACHFISLNGYLFCLFITVAMWAEVIRNVPGTLRPSMADFDRGDADSVNSDSTSSSTASEGFGLVCACVCVFLVMMRVH